VIETVNLTLNLSSEIALLNRGVGSVNVDWWINYEVIIINIYIWGLFFSYIPLVLILNSLIDKGIADKAEEREHLEISVSPNYSRHSINSID